MIIVSRVNDREDLMLNTDHVMRKQLGNGIKGKRSPGSQPRKSVRKGNRQNNSKGATQFH